MDVDMERCLGCGACVGTCPCGAFKLYTAGPVRDQERCTDCKACVLVCPVGAIDEEGGA